MQYTGSIEHAQPSNASSTEQPTCPVCLGTYYIPFSLPCLVYCYSILSFLVFPFPFIYILLVTNDAWTKCSNYLWFLAERLDQDTSGILTTICNHSFHCSCISKWADSSCPVSGFIQSLYARSNNSKWIVCFIIYSNNFLTVNFFISRLVSCVFTGLPLFISGMPLLPAASWKIVLFCLSNHWEPVDMRYMWVCWLRKVRLTVFSTNPYFMIFLSF